mmetsp:Transcript_14533/g.33562  ORF Transcript_14533/g.33562 Transcript_14533/m.33562 type:complete len:88 (+) Transcript_14533:268-531(+)
MGCQHSVFWVQTKKQTEPHEKRVKPGERHSTKARRRKKRRFFAGTLGRMGQLLTRKAGKGGAVEDMPVLVDVVAVQGFLVVVVAEAE